MKHEELLQNLTNIRGLMVKMQDKMTEYIQMERNFRAEQEGIGTESLADRSKLGAMAVFGAVALFQLLIGFLSQDFSEFLMMVVSMVILMVTKNKKSKLRLAALGLVVLSVGMTLYYIIQYLNFGLALIVLILLAAVVAAGYFVITRKNRSVKAYNEKVAQHNQMVQSKRQQLYNEYKALSRELTQAGNGWYPPDYCNIDAVNFFLNAVKNYRAESVKEMVNLYEQTAQHQEMIAYQKQQTAQLNQLVAGQQEIKRELRFANLVNAANFFQLGSINSNVQKLNQTAGGIRSGVQQLNQTTSGLRGDVKDLSNKANQLLHKRR